MSSSGDRIVLSIPTRIDLPRVDFASLPSKSYTLASMVYHDHVAKINLEPYRRIAIGVYKAQPPAFHFLAVAFVVSILIRLRQLMGIIWFCAGALSTLFVLWGNAKAGAGTNASRGESEKEAERGVENGVRVELDRSQIGQEVEKESERPVVPAESIEARLDAFAIIVEELKLELRQKVQAGSM